MPTQPKVFVMLSGGVDSSVAAATLKQQGYDVVGVFMKCWSIDQLESLGASKDLYGCFWEEDSRDAQLVADKLGIPFYVWDFQDQYKNHVVDYMLNEYRVGRTPNPDVMCNSVIKFGAFYDRAMQLGADFVATGHYARVGAAGLNFSNPQQVLSEAEEKFLWRGRDENKDQSYFMWRVKKDQIVHTLLPVGEFESKAKVREVAESYDLITAGKPDSQGLCFIGQTPLRALLIQVLGEREGEIQDGQGKVLGAHRGAYLYTIGQREGLGLAGGPWFVSDIDVDANVVKVAHQSNSQELFGSQFEAVDLNWLGSSLDLSRLKNEGLSCQAQIRYRQKAENCVLKVIDSESIIQVVFDNPIRAIAKGQSVVFYDGERMLGGAVIN